MLLGIVTIRNIAGLSPLLLLISSPLATQDRDVRADVPGTYVARKCAGAPFPAALPPLASVLDSAKLAADLSAAGVTKRVVFALRLGALATVPRVRILESKVADAVADRAAQAVEAALSEVPPDQPWAFHVVVAADREGSIKLDRSRVCGGIPADRVVHTRTEAVPAGELESLRREIAENRRHRSSMLHRVLVDTQGRVLAVELVKSSGDGQMDENETGALRRRRFSPTRLDGTPVSAWIELRGDFGLSPSP